MKKSILCTAIILSFSFIACNSRNKSNTETISVETNINQKMVEEHHAVEYHGQSKEEIRNEHIQNRGFVEL